MTRTTATYAPDGLVRWGLKINRDGKVVDVEGVDNPEFTDAPGLRRNFGIKRSLAYNLLDRGLIKGVSLRQPGAVRGKRLFFVNSVRAYLHSQMEGEQGAEKGDTKKAAGATHREKVIELRKKEDQKTAREKAIEKTEEAPRAVGRGRPRKGAAA